MIEKTLFKESCTNKIVTLISIFEDGCLQLDTATPIQHMCQRDRTVFLRHFIGGQPVKQAIGIFATHQNLGEGGDIHNAHSLSYGSDLCFDHVMNLIAAKRIMILLGNSITRKPARPLKTENLFMYGPFCLQKFMQS